MVVAVAVRGGGATAFDAGRAVQNVRLVARNPEIGSCPNRMPDPDRVARVLGLGADYRSVIVLSFGYPGRLRGSAASLAGEARAERTPLEEVVVRL